MLFNNYRLQKYSSLVTEISGQWKQQCSKLRCGGKSVIGIQGQFTIQALNFPNANLAENLRVLAADVSVAF